LYQKSKTYLPKLLKPEKNSDKNKNDGKFIFNIIFAKKIKLKIILKP